MMWLAGSPRVRNPGRERARQKPGCLLCPGEPHAVTSAELWGATLEAGYHTFHNLKRTMSYGSMQYSCHLALRLWK